MRLNIFRRLGVPRVPEIQEGWERTTRVFESGHIFHEWIQGITKDAGISVAQEVELQDEDLMVRGHFDDLVLVPPNPDGYDLDKKQGSLILYDYKTAHSKSFEYAKGRPMSYYHKMQLGTYMYMLRKEWGRGKQSSIDRAFPENKKYFEALELPAESRILKISKDDLRMSEDQLLWSPELEKEVVGYWRTLNGYWQKKSLPKCTCADHEGGFMAKRTKAGKVYNDFFYNGEPCSLVWYEQWKNNKETV